MAVQMREEVGVLEVEGRRVPWVVWSPADRAVEGLVLVGHGASADKRESYVVALGKLFAQRGIATLAIDGPIHGERRDPDSTSLPFFDFAAMWSSDEGMTDRMITDWRAALDHALAMPTLNGVTRIGYWGLSMGTILGLPLVVAESRISAYVLGLMGATGPTKERIIEDARLMTRPTMFLVQWDDQLFHRRDAFNLFDEIGTTDKVLISTPGNHGDVTPETFLRSVDFLESRLRGA